jgi:hypothetical protein
MVQAVGSICHLLPVTSTTLLLEVAVAVAVLMGQQDHLAVRVVQRQAVIFILLEQHLP